MYSLILMTAMSGAPEAPEFNGFFRNLFNGCRRESCYGCYGSGVSRSVGCYGSCDGFGSRVRAFFNRGSCYGSCYGTSYACYGSSYSCVGASHSLRRRVRRTARLRRVRRAARGRRLRPVRPDGPGRPRQRLPADRRRAGLLRRRLHARHAGRGRQPVRGAVLDHSADRDAGQPARDCPGGAQRAAAALASPTGGDKARGTVVVKLPTDAKLYAEGRPLPQTSGERTFVTPPLPGGRDYTYSFRAEYVRDGETISQSKRVAVRPGQSATVEFADLTLAKTGAKPDPVPLTRPTSAKAEPVSKPGNPFVGNAAPSAHRAGADHGQAAAGGDAVRGRQEERPHRAGPGVQHAGAEAGPGVSRT